MKTFIRLFALLFALMMGGRLIGGYGERWVFGYWGIPRAVKWTDELRFADGFPVGYVTHAVEQSGIHEELTLLLMVLCGSAAFFLNRLRSRLVEIEAFLAKPPNSPCGCQTPKQLPAGRR